MNINIKSEKGITMVAIVITIIILLIIVSTVSFSSKNGIDMKNINNMYTDIILLEEKIATYYIKNGELPIVENSLLILDELPPEIIDKTIYPNNNDNYYKIDLNKLSNITLNNARDASNVSDVYIINEKSHVIYYLKGVSVEEYTTGIKGEEKKTYYTIPRGYTEILANEIESEVLTQISTY